MDQIHSKFEVIWSTFKFWPLMQNRNFQTTVWGVKYHQKNLKKNFPYLIYPITYALCTNIAHTNSSPPSPPSSTTNCRMLFRWWAFTPHLNLTTCSALPNGAHCSEKKGIKFEKKGSKNLDYFFFFSQVWLHLWICPHRCAHPWGCYHTWGHTCGSLGTGVLTHVDTHVSTHEDIYVTTCVVPSPGVATHVTTCEDFLRCVHTCGPPEWPYRDWGSICFLKEMISLQSPEEYYNQILFLHMSHLFQGVRKIMEHLHHKI